MIMIHVTEKCYFEWMDTDTLMLLILSDAAQLDIGFLIVTRSVNDRTLLGQ